MANEIGDQIDAVIKSMVTKSVFKHFIFPQAAMDLGAFETTKWAK